MRSIDIIAPLPEEPVTSRDQFENAARLGGLPLIFGDGSLEAFNQFSVKRPDQKVDAVLSTLAMRILFEHGNRSAQAILGHNQLETFNGVDSLIESDVDDGLDALPRRFLLDGRGDRLRVSNRAKIGPCCGDIAVR